MRVVCNEERFMRFQSECAVFKFHWRKLDGFSFNKQSKTGDIWENINEKHLQTSSEEKASQNRTFRNDYCTTTV